MTKDDQQIIKDVKFILNSGDSDIINTLKVTIPAYLHCIAVNKAYEDLRKKQRKTITVIKGGKSISNT